MRLDVGSGGSRGGTRGDDHRQPSRASSVWLPVSIYSLLGLAAYFPISPGDSSRIPQCTCADAGLNTWFLAATAHAVAQGHNLFFNSTLNYPFGVNLTYNTGMPLLGLLAAPLPLFAGPIASLNFLMWLAFPLSASSMYLVLRRWTSWAPAAFAGGLLYGFSPYMIGQSTAHLFLIFVPLPPLLVLTVLELFVFRKGNGIKWGLALGLLAAAQFLISSEVLVITGLVALIGLIVLAATRPNQIVPSLRFAAAGMAWAILMAGGVLAYPVYLFFAGPGHYTSAFDSSSGILLRADLLGPAVPTSLERLTPSAWAAAGNKLTIFGDYSENGSYLGVPLLLTLVAMVLRCRRDQWISFTVGMAVIAFVLSLGSPLSINGHSTGIPLPDAVLSHLPLVDQLIPARFSLFTAFFVAVLVALALDQIHRMRPTRGAQKSFPQGPIGWKQTHRWRHAGLLAIVAALVLVPLIPRWPNSSVPSDTPLYFTSPSIDRITPGTVALTYPYAAPLHAQPMVWQAVAEMRFTLLGGYALTPNARGVPTLFPSLLHPAALQEFFINEEGGIPLYRSPLIADDSNLVGDVRLLVRRYHVGVVLVDPTAPHSGPVNRLIARALGRPPETSGGIEVWYDVQHAPGLGRTAS